MGAYVKERFIGESIRLIADTIHFTKQKNIPGKAVFLDFDKAFDSIEWNFIHKCLETFNLKKDIYKDISGCVLNNGYASKHFHLGREVRQGCPLSGSLFVISIELLVELLLLSSKKQLAAWT